ncbi:MAG: GlxA family transcriptional regulator [Paracoccaceae bacterium]
MVAKQRLVAEIGLLIYPDAQLSAVYGLTDLFRIAGEWAPTEPGAAPPAIRVSHWRAEPGDEGVACVHDSHPGAEHKLAYVIAPPSLVMPGDMQDMRPAAAWLAARHAEGGAACSVCAGAFVLAEAGLVDGRPATTHWAFAAALAERFPAVKIDADRMVIDDGDIITAGGILAWADLGLTLVERLMGPSVMLATARFLLVEPPGRSQRPFRAFSPRFDHGDAAVLMAQRRLHAAQGKGLSVSELAGTAGLEARTFLRRFSRATGFRPAEYAQQIRIAKAREELESSNRSVEQIAFDVGYSDPASFRRLFQRVTSLAPNAYRRRFGARATLGRSMEEKTT